MTERSSSHGQPDDWTRYRGGTADQHYYAQGMADSGPVGHAAPPARRAATRQAADERNFFAALFDFTFTSFITTKIIKVLYVLVMIIIELSAAAVHLRCLQAERDIRLAHPGHRGSAVHHRRPGAVAPLSRVLHRRLPCRGGHPGAGRAQRNRLRPEGRFPQ